jgi:WD40 repeat protein
MAETSPAKLSNSNPVRALVFSHSGKQLASRNLDGTTRLWSTALGTAFNRPMTAFSSCNDYFALALGETVSLWNLANDNAPT